MTKTQLEQMRETAEKQYRDKLNCGDSQAVTGTYLINRLLSRIKESEYWNIVSRPAQATDVERERWEAITSLKAAQDKCRRLKLEGYEE